MRRPNPILTSLLAALALVGCDAAAVDGSYQGEPLFTVSGWVRVESLDGPLEQRGRLRMAVLWASPEWGSPRFDVITSVAERVDASGSFPARYELTLYAPPADSLIRPDAVPSGDAYAVGVLAAFEDANDDGRWDSGAERLIGAVMNTAIVYAPSEGTPSEVVYALPGTFPAGYSLAVVNADPATCNDAGQAELIYQPTREADLTVNMAFPFEAALDLDCDGSQAEWLSFCPMLFEVHELCVGGIDISSGDPMMCDLCAPFLPPADADADACDAWLWRCHEQMAIEECEPEWARCRSEAAAAACDDRVCICDTLVKGCLGSGQPSEDCTGFHSECLAF